jgi:GAF domain-containing protein
VIVLAKLGRNRFTADHEATLSIFAGHAAQALVNADNAERVRHQQAELELRLAGQRRLLEVNTELLATLDPVAVLDTIADLLKEVVTYHALTIYRVDRDTGRRWAVIARDRFAEVILREQMPIGVGITGWAIDHRQAVLCNDALEDPRCVQIPGTPVEPESMLIVPLQVGGDVIGTLNVARMGGAESHFTEYEFELTQLFGGQASIALQNAEAHLAMKVRADHDSLTGLGNHGAFQRDLGLAIERGGEEPFAVLMLDLDSFKRFNDTQGHRSCLPLRRRRVLGDHRGDDPAGCRGSVRPDPASGGCPDLEPPGAGHDHGRHLGLPHRRPDQSRAGRGSRR